jgi:hypothetical protein
MNDAVIFVHRISYSTPYSCIGFYGARGSGPLRWVLRFSYCCYALLLILARENYHSQVGGSMR